MDLLGHPSRAGVGPVPTEVPESREPRSFVGLQLSLGLSLGSVAETKVRAMASSEAVSSAHPGGSFSLGLCESAEPTKDLLRAGQGASVAGRRENHEGLDAESSRAHEGQNTGDQPQRKSSEQNPSRGSASLDAQSSNPSPKEEPDAYRSASGEGGLKESGAEADSRDFAPRVKEEAQEAADEAVGPEPGSRGQSRKRALDEEESEGQAIGQELALRGQSDAGNSSLNEEDPAIWRLVELEKERQLTGIELIASENFVSQVSATMDPNISEGARTKPGFGCS